MTKLRDFLKQWLPIAGTVVTLVVTYYLFFQVWTEKTTEPAVSLAEKAISVTVGIDVYGINDNQIYGVLGSGVFIDKGGTVLTCAHLFSHGEVKQIVVTDWRGSHCNAELQYIEKNRDLAILSTNFFNNKFANIADPTKLKVGQALLIVGSPLGLTFSVTHGIISALNRDFPWMYNSTQCDAMVAPGNSGGPAFNRYGEIVGIVSFYIPLSDTHPNNTGLSFMVSSAQVLEFLTRYHNNKKQLAIKAVLETLRNL